MDDLGVRLFLDTVTHIPKKPSKEKSTKDPGLRPASKIKPGPVYEFLRILQNTPPKTNMDTQNDGLEKVTPFEYGHFWYLC